MMDGEEEEEEEAVGPEAAHHNPLSNAARRTLRANYRKMQSKTVGEWCCTRLAAGAELLAAAPCVWALTLARADEKDELALPTNGLLVKRLEEAEKLHRDAERGARLGGGS